MVEFRYFSVLPVVAQAQEYGMRSDNGFSFRAMVAYEQDM